MKLLGFSTVVFPEAGSYTAWCIELDVASQGDSLEEAIDNLKEAMELHIECLTASELRELRQKHGMRFLTTVEVKVPA